MYKTISEPKKYRENVVKIIKNIILENIKKDKVFNNIKTEKQLNDIFINVEKSIYNYSITEATSKKTVKKWDNPFFVQIYEDRLRSIYRNLNNNPQFIIQILNEEIKGNKLSNITHIEMAPEQWKDLIDLKIKKDMNKFNTNEQSSTDMFQCRKCKSRRCQYYELQVRSADEGTSVFISCLDCGKHWRQN